MTEANGVLPGKTVSVHNVVQMLMPADVCKATLILAGGASM